jgi:integrase
MLQTTPKKTDRIFSSLSSTASNFYIQRKTLARKLNNPRILKISLHTLRHWKATMEYHKTKDIIHVQQILGHRDIKSTMIYINLEQALFSVSSDEFHVKTAENADEACRLAEAGFEHFDTIDKIHIYRKRK